MAENITTLNEIRERTLAEGFTPNINDIVPVDHGSGSKRHRAFTLGEIGNLLMGGGGLSEIELKKALAGGGYKVVTVDGESMKFSQYGGSSPDGTVTDLSMLGMSVKVTSQGYDTATEVKRNGVVVSYGPTGGTAEKTEVLYNKVRTKSIEGTAAGSGSANAKELVIASGLHISNANGSQYLMVDGLAEFNGNSYFKGDVIVGNNLVPKSVQVNGKISKAKYVIESNMIELTGDDTLIGFADGKYDVGEIVHVYNPASTARKVYFAYIGGPAYIEIKSKCTISFRCITAGAGNWEWSPMCNVDYDVETASNE